MSNGRNKYHSRETRREVRRILLEIWDPIGIGHLPNCPDEYDRYIGEIYVMLMARKQAKPMSPRGCTGWEPNI